MPRSRVDDIKDKLDLCAAARCRPKVVTRRGADDRAVEHAHHWPPVLDVEIPEEVGMVV